MAANNSELEVIPFVLGEFDAGELAARLTELKALASRTPTPVTAAQLEAIGKSDTGVLLLQIAGEGADRQVVGLVHLAINYLEDRAHLGPICVDKDSEPRGYGTQLMEEAIAYLKANYTGLRRLDLSNRPSHELAEWYKKFGFVPRTAESGDPTTVYRLPL